MHPFLPPLARADNGVVHVVADAELMAETLPSLDLSRARLLAKLGSFWMQRSRDLSAVLQGLLGVQAVWCDTRRCAAGGVGAGGSCSLRSLANCVAYWLLSWACC
jgi:hypothetical protein